MVERNDQDYPFIKETIKKRPVNKKAAVQKILMAALCGIIFGACAALTIAATMPAMLKVLGKEAPEQEEVTLSPPAASQTETSAEDAGAAGVTGTVDEMSAEGDGQGAAEPSGQESAGEGEASGTVKAESAAPGNEAEGGVSGETESAADADGMRADLADHLENIYNEIKKIAAEPQKALVRVTGIGDKENLLDHSSLTYGDEEGIIFLKNKDAFYILTRSETLGDSGKFRVDFSTGDSGEGTLCGADERTNLLVIKVGMDELDDETAQTVPAVSLATEADQEQADPVIAIGSPTGDAGTLVYGNITSVLGKYRIPDAEYTILTTDMVGSSSGGGVLLDMDGQMTGIMFTDGEEDGTVVRAVSAAQLRPLLEMLSNGENIRYTGIIGETVTEEKAEELEIPLGIYVDSVEENSPAMAAGIQSGDIIFELDGREVRTMEEYSEVLQDLPVQQRADLSLYRRMPSGEYEEVDLRILVVKN